MSRSQTFQTSVIFKRTKHHKGSIYCTAWSKDGKFIATGSNDKSIKIMQYSDENKQLEGREIELTMHDGTVRDLCFLEDFSNERKLLASGGAGNCKIYITDCNVLSPSQTFIGHSGHIFSTYSWDNNMLVTGSQVGTCSLRCDFRFSRFIFLNLKIYFHFTRNSVFSYDIIV